MPSARYTREIPQRYRLEAETCSGCGKVFYPPRLVCSACGGREFESTKLPDTGKVLTYTIIHIGPSDFSDEVPYPLAIVELADGVRLMTQLADVPLEKVEIGMPIKLEFRRMYQEGKAGILCYGHKAVPA